MTAAFDLHADGAPPADPLDLARSWLPADDDPDRPQVVLSTVGEDGCPDARTVLLSGVDGSGFAFHTSRGSRKVAQLAAVPRASMTVLWPGFTRQLVLRGPVVAEEAGPLTRAWSARSDHLRRLAWLNTDELAAQDLAARRLGWAADVPVDAGSTPAPSWVGFRLRPVELTFWAGGADTASRRLRYVRQDDGWRWQHLAG
ncbi:pyridoxamine 5'-phosphate oxidase [Klenkia soli]|uniref:Pyridoxamine 5'-phosphate oxidase n=1 Tax=Klenkia soli TaxID=1052260 RepID=A0A1H0KG42_9ACTN|nr:pyridoxamine 5'-phosphate oxidase family protein [Klenkia soli]SDO54865.1 pyridoxamine 5'-phosphate oxidase [Klenkia soli]